MSQVFERYERQYCELSANLSRKCTSASILDGGGNEICPLLLKLHGVDDNIGRSKKILTAMSRRMNRNKWIISSIIATLVLAILLILYFKFTH